MPTQPASAFGAVCPFEDRRGNVAFILHVPAISHLLHCIFISFRSMSNSLPANVSGGLSFTGMQDFDSLVELSRSRGGIVCATT